MTFSWTSADGYVSVTAAEKTEASSAEEQLAEGYSVVTERRWAPAHLFFDSSFSMSIVLREPMP